MTAIENYEEDKEQDMRFGADAALLTSSDYRRCESMPEQVQVKLEPASNSNFENIMVLTENE